MRIARAHLVDPAVTRWYHLVTRCVPSFLLGEGKHGRKSSGLKAGVCGVIGARADQ